MLFVVVNVLEYLFDEDVRLIDSLVSIFNNNINETSLKKVVNETRSVSGLIDWVGILVIGMKLSIKLYS